MTLAEFRHRFPILERRIYLNSCSQGALSLDVERALVDFQASWHDHGSPWDRWMAQVESLRSAFAASIGADASEVALVPSASVGISSIASALTFPAGRDRVVLGELEFPTMSQIWLAQAPRGAQVCWAGATGDELPLDRYAAVVDEHTRIVPVTHVCFKNGFRSDVEGLVALCRERGAYVFLDDYQRTGTGPIDVHRLGVDFMVTGCLKYLLGPAGIAMLYVRGELLERLEPTMTGWFGRVQPFAFRHDCLDWSASARRFETGTPPIPNVYGALAGLELITAVGLETIRGRISRLVSQVMQWADDAGVVTATPPDPLRRGPLVVVRSTDAAALVERLATHGIVASTRGTGLRISFHGYNVEDDVRALIAALEAEVALLVRRRS